MKRDDVDVEYRLSSKNGLLVLSRTLQRMNTGFERLVLRCRDGRLRANFAALCGASPIPASSGKITRHG